MNFLAHALLAGKDDGLIIGNLIADFLKGRPDDLSPSIARGVMMHRKIDRFTDSHPVMRQSIARIPEHKPYGAVIMDVHYDHLLAGNFESITGESLEDFVKGVNEVLEKVRNELPLFLQNRIDNLNWLTGYREVAGVEKALRRLSARSRRDIDLCQALPDLAKHHPCLQADFQQFFPEMQAFAREMTQ